MTDWTREEDGQPGRQHLRHQPEVTAKGRVWTQLIEVHWPMEGRTQLIIRDDGGDYHLDHGRVFPLRATEDDGA